LPTQGGHYWGSLSQAHILVVGFGVMFAQPLYTLSLQIVGGGRKITNPHFHGGQNPNSPAYQAAEGDDE
jgi:hypothetical protein